MTSIAASEPSGAGRVRPPVVLECEPGADHAVNVDEALVGRYRLPDPLRFEDGAVVTSATWPDRRREILHLFEDHVFGRTPLTMIEATSEEVETGLALGGAAVRRQLRLGFENDGGRVQIEVLIYRPADASGPVPVFLLPNFEGNHTVADDAAIVISDAVAQMTGDDVPPRGSKRRRFPIAAILERGYGLATFHAGDVDPDHDDGFANGVHPLHYAVGQTVPEPYEWGTIGAWAWGCSRVLDALHTDSGVDGDRVIVGGHSRLGKTALWAAAQDERFAAAFSNDSGCTGAALSRRVFGENVAVINALFPHWFCRNYRCYGDNESALPVDQHQLLALIAPRPVHVASATEDLWADPVGEFLAARAVNPVYELLGEDGLAIDTFPEAGEASIGTVSYHLREGPHDLVEADWWHYLDFADRHIG